MKHSFFHKLAWAFAAAFLAVPAFMIAAHDVPAASASSSFSLADIDRYNDTEAGRSELLAELQQKDGVNDDWELNRRVETIMTNLTAAIGSIDPTIYEKPYQYFINTRDGFNAFCTLGHIMSINQGIFENLDDDSEIAVVLGHEMGHGQSNHPVDAARQALSVKSIVQSSGGSLDTLLAAALVKNQYTKPMEWAADNLAFAYITHSYYNPGATAAVWQRVIDQYGENSSPFLAALSNHPASKDRRDNYERKIESYANGHVSVTTDGVVMVDTQPFCIPAAANGMSSHERAYLVEGNLAAAFHSGHNCSAAYADGSTVMLGAQPIMTCVSGDEDAWTLADRLNQIKDGRR
ncbi:M48 family metallopeptidase [uncultured Selenomonas sp.]|uniref:M48 family metallopeptidase n=1 Tax=uncultured Selenomonas sp. TaxID=159275 RepID=UPI0025DD8516|nr:M48 family metallopeptidase [uncultured Selenomonas sp.]